ncbi:hypothetical protein E5358_10255 [Palleniella muris]|uniref:Uncharacterized protein n=1 Tax=Palleniella muris TaxID=3038145 RepID=A0AC61QP43_9BACT|nr:WbqC family protein [Palleniella muris]TGX81508.1 hypothetical protein E5358_10255 [Palleniella muris]
MLLSTTYFGPVQWYSLLSRCTGSRVSIEARESFQKQTYRNRCVIATANGTQALTIPVTHAGSNLIKDIRISDHGNWRHLHWQALCTAYGESAFFEYYQDDIRPFFIDEGPASPVHLDCLLDYNMASAELMCRLLDLDISFDFTEEFIPSDQLETVFDYRDIISPKAKQTDPFFTPKPYYQVYRQRHGFLPNLSILDLLFNEGPEAIKYLL